MSEAHRSWARAALLAALVTSVSGCAQLPSTPSIPATGEVAGERILASVDSEAARYYLERYLRGKRSNPGLDAAFDRLHEAPATVPTRAELKRLSQRYSTDLAALYLAQRLSAIDINRHSQTVFRRELQEVRPAMAAGSTAGHPRFGDYLLLFVPGWDYVETGHFTGADFALQRRLLQRAGFENRLLEVPPTGSIESIAAAIARELRQLDSDKEWILANASSGGTAVALALAETASPAERCRVKAWINIGGLLQGTPLADRYLRWPRSWIAGIVGWYYGWEADAVTSMSVERSRARFARLRLPAHVYVLNYVAIPLSGTVSELARERYLRLRPEGPNDGLTLITDALVPHKPTLIALGQDHFLAQDTQIGPKTLALARTLMVLLDRTAAKPC